MSTVPTLQQEEFKLCSFSIAFKTKLAVRRFFLGVKRSDWRAITGLITVMVSVSSLIKNRLHRLRTQPIEDPNTLPCVGKRPTGHSNPHLGFLLLQLEI